MLGEAEMDEAGGEARGVGERARVDVERGRRGALEPADHEPHEPARKPPSSFNLQNICKLKRILLLLL